MDIFDNLGDDVNPPCTTPSSCIMSNIMPLDLYRDVAKDFLKLSRLRYERPDLVQLEKLMRAFSRLPYENFTKIIRAREFEGDGRLRSPDIVLGDHMDHGTGGTCFSLTHFFEQVLKFNGYETYPVLCDRSYGPDTHCALIARVSGKKCLVDPGFLMEAPLRLPPEGHSLQEGITSSIKLARLGTTSQFLLFSEGGGKSKLRYRLRDIPIEPEAFKKRWVDSFEWAMMRHPCISRMTENGQIFMRDKVLRSNKKNGRLQESIAKKFEDTVSDLFDVDKKIVERAVSCIKKGRTDR